MLTLLFSTAACLLAFLTLDAPAETVRGDPFVDVVAQACVAGILSIHIGRLLIHVLPYPLPPMPTPRDEATVAAFGMTLSFLSLASGDGGANAALSLALLSGLLWHAWRRRSHGDLTA